MSNYRIVLQHSIPAEPITGRLATPGIWVKFENGAAEVKDEKTIQMLLSHPLYKTDFVAVEEEGRDPYEDNRQPNEPIHAITKIEFGHVTSSINPQSVPQVSRETKKLVMEMAKEMAKEMAAEMAPNLAKQMLKEVLSQNPELVKGALAEASGVVDLVDDITEEETTEPAKKTNKGAAKVK